jgi:hypothetical protein
MFLLVLVHKHLAQASCMQERRGQIESTRRVYLVLFTVYRYVECIHIIKCIGYHRIEVKYQND